MFNPNDRERRILERIKSIKRPPQKKVVVKQPKKGLSKEEKQVKELLAIINGKEKASIKLNKVLKRLK